MYIMAPEPILAMYFINPFHQCVYPPIIAGQWPGKNVTAATNTHRIEELFDMFSMCHIKGICD
jgi:hypothetical protein